MCVHTIEEVWGCSGGVGEVRGMDRNDVTTVYLCMEFSNTVLMWYLMWYSHTMKGYTSVKTEQRARDMTTCTDLQNIMLKEGSKSQRL